MGDNKISEAARFTKRPVTIEAMQFDGSTKSASAICQWANAGDDAAGHDDPTVSYTTTDGDDAAHDMIVWTLEGDMRASPGDWIIKGVKGEFYPCKPDIFEMTYSPHLQGEAVPVGFVDLANLGAGLPSEECFYIAWQDECTVPVYTHPQPAELADQQGVELPPLPSPAHESVSECGPDYFDASQMRQYARAALAATGKQQVITGPTGPDPLTLSGLIVYGRVAGNPNQGAVPSHMCNLIRQMIPYLERLEAMEKGDVS